MVHNIILYIFIVLPLPRSSVFTRSTQMTTENGHSNYQVRVWKSDSPAVSAVCCVYPHFLLLQTVQTQPEQTFPLQHSFLWPLQDWFFPALNLKSINVEMPQKWMKLIVVWLLHDFVIGILQNWPFLALLKSTCQCCRPKNKSYEKRQAPTGFSRCFRRPRRPRRRPCRIPAVSTSFGCLQSILELHKITLSQVINKQPWFHL